MYSACRGVTDDIAAMVDVSEALPSESAVDGREGNKHADAVDEATPTTTASDDGELTTDDETESAATGAEGDETETEDQAAEPQLGPGLFPADADDERELLAPMAQSPPMPMTETEPASEEREAVGAGFTPQETCFVFDWDDTILPSSWIQRQGLRLDSRSIVSAWQYEQLGQVATTAAEMLRLAEQQGTVVLVTNAERGWIELSCHKFMPMLLPTIENMKIVSARTTYESASCTERLDWKVLAFEAEIARACGVETLIDPAKRKNIHSLGDNMHEREALMRATKHFPNCCTKSVKFVEHPGIGQILKQHALVNQSFDKIVQHDGDLDLTINCL